MRIIDRYVFSSFLRNYLISFMVLIGMYVVLDMVFHFDELVDVDATAQAGALANTLGMLWNILDYYFYQSFLFFVHLSGIIPVVAAAFTLLRLSRFGELTALLAAGVPLLRVAAPIIIASVVLNAAGWFAYARVGSDLASALDQDLRARGQDLSALVASAGSVSSTQGALIENGESFSEIVDAQGRVVDATPPIGRNLLAPAELAAARSGPVFMDRPSVPGLDEPAPQIEPDQVRGSRFELRLERGPVAHHQRLEARALEDLGGLDVAEADEDARLGEAQGSSPRAKCIVPSATRRLPTRALPLSVPTRERRRTTRASMASVSPGRTGLR